MRRWALFLLFVPRLLFADLSLEDQVGQIFIGIVHGEELDDSAKQFIQRTRIGNFLYFRWSNGLHSFEQVAKLSFDLTAFCNAELKLPPIIACDEEGGRVSRLTYFSSPSNAELQDAYGEGLRKGRALLASGISLNFAPVVDLGDPLKLSRSFSEDPLQVIDQARLMIQGMHAVGVGATLKHFPGLGKANVDPHHLLPVIFSSQEKMFQEDLLPFRALSNEADAMMTAHVLCPCFDSLKPATHSERILKDLLREQFGYEGLIISDSLMMRGISPDQSSIEEAIESVTRAAIDAFNAGCDLLILASLEWADFLPTKEQDLEVIEAVIENVVRAVRHGEISKERLNESLDRILQFKAALTPLAL